MKAFSGTAQSKGRTFNCSINGTTQLCTYACTHSGGCINIAVGYDCPSYCKASSEGFSKQVIRAAWKLKFNQQRALGNYNWNVQKTGWDNSDDPPSSYNGPMTKGNLKRCSSCAVTYFDGYYTTLDSFSNFMGSGATASLYYYTTFRSGNQNFVNIYEGWFGSTLRDDTNTPHPNGTLVSYAGTIFLIQDGEKLPIASTKIFASYRYHWKDLKAASSGDISLPTGSRLPFAPGTLIRTDSGSVYVMEYDGSTVKKRAITGSAFRALNYSWAEVLYLKPSEMPSDSYPGSLSSAVHPSGALVLDHSTNTIFLINKGTRRPIPNLTVFGTYKFTWGMVKPATTGDNLLTMGTRLELREGYCFIVWWRYIYS